LRSSVYSGVASIENYLRQNEGHVYSWYDLETIATRMEALLKDIPGIMNLGHVREDGDRGRGAKGVRSGVQEEARWRPMRALLLGISMWTPMLTGLIGAFLQPHDQPSYRTRYRCFRECGGGRLRSIFWLFDWRKDAA
jgi:hypothetical protein